MFNIPDSLENNLDFSILNRRFPIYSRNWEVKSGKMELNDRLKILRGRLSRLEFSEKLGIPQSTLQNWEVGSSSPKADALKRLHETIGLNIHWLLTGEGEPFKDKEETLQVELYDPTPEPVIKKIGSSLDRIDPDQYAYVPLVKSKLSAGDGSFEADDSNKRHYAFRRSWLSAVASSVRNLVLVFIHGDSMEPVVSHGDMAMIDRGRTTIHDGGVYAIGIHDALYIKRLIMQPNGRVCVVSENEKRYPTFESDYESLRILGQIIWIARQLI